MRAAALLLALAGTAAAQSYTAYHTDPLTWLNTNNWYVNGSIAATGAGVNANPTGGGSLISKLGTPDGAGPQDYEVKVKLNIPNNGATYPSATAYYVIYLRASADAVNGSPMRGTFYALELTWTGHTGEACTAWMQFVKYAGGVSTGMSGKTVPCRNGMELRAFIKGGAMAAHIDGQVQLWADDNSITTGRPGRGRRRDAIGQRDLRPGAAHGGPGGAG